MKQKIIQQYLQEVWTNSSQLKNHLQRSRKVSPLMLLKKNISPDFTDEKFDEVSMDELVLPDDLLTLN